MNLTQAILNLNEYAIVIHNKLKEEEKKLRDQHAMPDQLLPALDRGLRGFMRLDDDGDQLGGPGGQQFFRMPQTAPTNHDIFKTENNYNIENCLIKKLTEYHLPIDHLQLIKQFPTDNLIESLTTLKDTVSKIETTDIDIDTIPQIKNNSKLRKDIIYHVFNDYKLFMNINKLSLTKDNKDVLDKFEAITKERYNKNEKINVFETTQIEEDAKMTYIVSKEKLLSILDTIISKYTKIEKVAKSLQQIKARMITLMQEYMSNLKTYIKIVKLKYDIEKITQLISEINAKMQKKDEVLATDKRLLKIYNNYNLSLLEVLHNVDTNELKKKMIYSLYELILFRNTIQEFYFFATFSTCKICLVMNTDTILSCGHAFCSSCIEKNKVSDDGTKKCYNCRQTINWYKNLYPNQNILA